jgi:hypothetical protein
LFFKQFGFRGFASWAAANLQPCVITMEAWRARLPFIQDEQLPTRVQALLVHAQGHLGRLAALLEQCELDITEHGRQRDAEQRLCTLNGIDPITSSAIGRERR